MQNSFLGYGKVEILELGNHSISETSTQFWTQFVLFFFLLFFLTFHSQYGQKFRFQKQNKNLENGFWKQNG